MVAMNLVTRIISIIHPCYHSVIKTTVVTTLDKPMAMNNKQEFKVGR